MFQRVYDRNQLKFVYVNTAFVTSVNGVFNGTPCTEIHLAGQDKPIEALGEPEGYMNAWFGGAGVFVDTATLRRALDAAKEAYTVFEEENGRDDDWQSWYADFMSRGLVNGDFNAKGY